jgi:hypothetical protein
MLAAALGCALNQHGWIIENNPGNLQLVGDNHRLNPHRTMERMKSGELAPEVWELMIAGCGLDPSTPLGPREPAQA